MSRVMTRSLAAYQEFHLIFAEQRENMARIAREEFP